MKIRKRGYWWLFALTIIFTLAAISTLLPSEHVNKTCMLAYNAHCSFTPISTLMCIIMAGASCTVRKKFFVSYK